VLHQADTPRGSWRRRAVVLGRVLLLAVLVAATGSCVGSSAGSAAPNYSLGTNYYQPTPEECPYYNAWTPDCYAESRERIAADLEFMSENEVGNLQRLWISLDQLFACFDERTGFCGYDEQALDNVLDTLRLMADYQHKAVVVLFAQSSRPEDVKYFRSEALDGEHPEMRAGYIEAAEEFVGALAADPAAASAVYAVDLQNEGYFQNRKVLSDRDTRCGDDTGCIDRTMSRPFFLDLRQALEEVAPEFPYTVSALSGELLGADMQYWLEMYPVDVYDVHLYVTDPQDHTEEFRRVQDLPGPWYAGEVGTANVDDEDDSCYTYDGDDPCTAATATWWRQHLGPDYGAEAVLVEHWGTLFQYSDGAPELTRTGRSLASPG
jgi:hypothetical protein